MPIQAYKCTKCGMIGSVEFVLFTTVERICANASCGGPVLPVPLPAAPVEPDTKLDKAIKQVQIDLRGTP